MRLLEEYLKTFDSSTLMEGLESISLFTGRTREDRSYQETVCDSGEHIFVSDSGYCYEKNA